MEPAPYPPNNTEELSAINTFEGLLDPRRLKAVLNSMDKVPNHDGTIELVDDEQRPIGELKVQIKKIPKGDKFFDCPVRLVAYSERISCPFLLVCVDVENRKAYWKQISALMPGFVSDQKTFRVKFHPGVDEVGNGFSYFARWRELCSDYLERVQKFPKYKKILEEEMGLLGVSLDDRILFQKIADEINVLLDVDFPVVKHEYFEGAWKIGICIHQVDAQAVRYSIYKIPFGENAPLVKFVAKNVGPPKLVGPEGGISNLVSLSLRGGESGRILDAWVLREHLGDPVSVARGIIFDYLKGLLKNRRLYIHGYHQSVEVLMKFAEDNYEVIGLTSSWNYKISDISYGLDEFLPMWYSLVYPKVMKFFRENYADMVAANPFPFFEQIKWAAQSMGGLKDSGLSAEPNLSDEIRRSLAAGDWPHEYPFQSDRFSIRVLRQAIDYLISNGIGEIARLNRPSCKVDKYWWDCYNIEDLKHNAKLAVEGAFRDYPEFVKGNRFDRFKSRYLSRDFAVICVIESHKWTGKGGSPRVIIYILADEGMKIPRGLLIDLSEDPGALVRKGGVVTVLGDDYDLRSIDYVDLDLFSGGAVRELVYYLLEDDLKFRFGETFGKW